MKKNILIANISRLVTMTPLGVVEDAAVLVSDGIISWVGPSKDLPKKITPDKTVDAKGLVVMPGLVDCHTHLVHAGSRQNEFDLRSQGKSYQEIAKEGGGIMSTVRATRAASAKDLLESARKRLSEAISLGITTMEVKTGYGLDLETEMKMAHVISELKKDGKIDVLGTFLGAHVVPAEYKDKREEYVKLVTDKMLPAVAKEKVISACDVFVEEGAFGKAEARLISDKARSFGLKLHLHVDQFTDVEGGELAAELGALSADHLDHTSEAGMKAMAEAGVVGVLLPGASFFAGRGHYPDARKMIEQGMTVAVATDYNPGTNPSLDLLGAATIAVTQMGMTCDEALLAVTKNAAKALGLSDRGEISNGKRADLIFIDAPDEYFPLYRYTTNLVKKVMFGGKMD